MEFGDYIRKAREASGLKQRELASKILKEDGRPISPQYLNDIERNRRTPDSAMLIEQFAEILRFDKELLYFSAGRIPEELSTADVDQKAILRAYRAFRRELNG